jgi:acyl-CoA reductase-like NAD-dependent aldehyde dehydrogenase
VFTQDINQAIYISDAMETGTVQVNAAPARGPDVSFTVVQHTGAAAQLHTLLIWRADPGCNMRVLLP